ncbi:MAG: MFS transporter [Ruminococcaceae bacterium]|nr:MFS transporter [Oscillospiraceae bacterium]
MEVNVSKPYLKDFVPYALAAFLVGAVGGFTAVLGPAFVSNLNLPYNNTTWTALSMAASTAAFAPILGKLGDVIGRRITLFIGIAIFTLGNILTAVAPSLFFMIIARFIVGIGSAAIAPVVMSYIVTEFPPEKIAKGFSLYMLISSSAVIFGPTLGGLLIEFYDWRTMMWVCVAISVIILLLCIVTHKKDGIRLKPLTHFDSIGSFWVLIFFTLMLCLPSFGQNYGIRSVWFIIILIASVISFAGLIYAEKKAINPILSWKFMKRKKFFLSVLALFLTQGLMQANMTNIIVFINYTQPDNTIISSYAISIMYIGMSLGSVILGPLADRTEPKKILAVSLALTGIGCAIMLLFTAKASVILLAASLGILGFGLGGNASIFMKVVLSGVPNEVAGAGTGTYGLFRDLAAPFGVAIFVPLFTNRVTNIVNSGANEITAAIKSIKFLAIAEILCVIAGIAIVLFLPKIYIKKGEKA